MGEPAAEAIGRSFELYVHPEDVHLCREFLHRVLATGKKQAGVEYRVQCRDGDWRWHLSNGSPLKDHAGRVTGSFRIARDITERKRAVDDLRAGEEYLRTILQTTVDGFLEVDCAGPIVEVNDAYCAMSGYRRDEIVGLHVSDINPEAAPADVDSRICNVRLRGSGIFESRHRRRDGSVFPVQVSLAWLEAKGGRVVCFTRDMTERNESQARILHLQKAESLGRMAAAVAHHYNNLLTVVLGSLELLEIKLGEGAAGADVGDDLAAARNAALPVPRSWEVPCWPTWGRRTAGRRSSILPLSAVTFSPKSPRACRYPLA